MKSAELQDLGGEIFLKWVKSPKSPFAGKELCKAWLATAKEDACREIEVGFYKAENKWSCEHPEYSIKGKFGAVSGSDIKLDYF